MGTWSVVNTTTGQTSGSGGSSITLTIPSTAAGSALVVFSASSHNSPSAISSVTSNTGSPVWVHPTGCSANDTTNGEVDGAYCLAIPTGTTSVTVNWAAGNGTFGTMTVYEIANTVGIAFDNCNATDDSTSSTSLAAPSLSITGGNDIFLQACLSANVSSINLSYTLTTDQNVNGFAYLLNQPSYSAPTWTNSPAAPGAVAVIAMKEPSSTVFEDDSFQFSMSVFKPVEQNVSVW